MAPAASNARRWRGAALAGCCLLACGAVLALFWSSFQEPPARVARSAARPRSALEPRLHTRSRVVPAPPPLGAGAREPAASEGEAELVAGARTTQGWVLDGLGGPIAGAGVTARSQPGGPVEARTLSRADGGFTLGLASSSVELCAELDGYSLDCIHAATPSDGNTLRLLPASSIVGRVLMAEGGAAVAGATVEATQLLGTSSPRRTSRTDAQGAFSLAALPAGTYSLAATSPAARSREARVVVGVGETADPVLLLATPAVQVTGEVLVGGAPCRSGSVRLSGHLFVESELAGEGKVVLSGVLPGRYSALATCEGAVTPPPVSLELGAAPVHQLWELEPLPREAPSVADIAPDPGVAPLVVHVQSDGDVPLDLQVFVDWRGGARERARRQGARFLFDALPLGKYRVYAQDRLEEAVQVELTRAGQAATVELQLTAGAQLSGVVLDDRDAPVADAWVSGVRADAPVAYRAAPVLTDVEGRFSLPAARHAPYRLTVSSPAGGAVLDEVKAGELIVRVARPASVAGSVWTRERGLVPEFTVELAPRHGTEQHEVRGVASRFFVPAVEPGEYDLRLRSVLGNADRTLRVAAGEEAVVELSLPGALD